MLAEQKRMNLFKLGWPKVQKTVKEAKSRVDLAIVQLEISDPVASQIIEDISPDLHKDLKQKSTENPDRMWAVYLTMPRWAVAQLLKGTSSNAEKMCSATIPEGGFMFVSVSFGGTIFCLLGPGAEDMAIDDLIAANRIGLN